MLLSHTPPKRVPHPSARVQAFRADSVFYMVPDKLRRPLMFYFAHPAALYINKMHQVR